METATIIMKLSSDLNEDRLSELTRGLLRDLRDADIEARMPESRAESGSRGNAVTIGELLMLFISSGAAVSLIGCLRAYIARDRTLKIRIVKSGGDEVVIDAANVDSESVLNTVQALSRD